MSDLPSERAVWNVKVLVGFMILGVYFSLLYYGVSKGVVTVEQAFALLGNALGGGFVGWLYK